MLHVRFVRPVIWLSLTACGLNCLLRYFRDLSVGGQPPERLIIGLYGEVVPKTVANFKALCAGSEGLTYTGSEIYRVVQGLSVQGGDILSRGGNSGKSIYGDSSPVENFTIM